jgi:phospholipid/cholesterol/gamma-HCH transport system ATP-binding protein
VNPQNVLELKNVSVVLGGDTILQDINLKIPHGQSLIIVGPSGGGKSVLMKTLAGIIRPTQGHAFCDDVDWTMVSFDAKREISRKIGVQFQKSALFDSLSVFENVEFPLREHFPDMKQSEVDQKVQQCLEAVDLWMHKKLLPHELSGGMQLRLGIARAIVLNPKITFFDDPTAGLDPINSDKMIDLIMDLKKKYNSTMVVITHEIHRAYQMAGKIILVANKTVIDMGSAEESRAHNDPRVQQFIQGLQDGPLVWG